MILKAFTYVCTLLLIIQSTVSIEISELYAVTGPNGDVLPRGDENFQYVKLDSPVHLYTEKYDLVYVSGP